MQARLIAYPPEDAALIRLIGPGDVIDVGRDPVSGLVLDHSSVSRAHARLHGAADHFRLLDLDSKNGSFVDGFRCRDIRLPASCWLRFGDVYCELVPVSEAELASAETGLQQRRLQATAHTARIQGLTRLDDLLEATLRAVLELAQCERGFVLLAASDGTTADWTVRSCLSLEPAALAGREFSGSVGAVQQAIRQHRPVIANDVSRVGWLARRDSVVMAGISALACLPLIDGDRILGALYVDRLSHGPALSTLDVELLKAFTENAAVWISARRASEVLDARAKSLPDWGRIVAAHPLAAFGDA
ncbi:GAF domain-containing protein [Novilysobacter arseniciresistens]|uniref:GAF domain-containing protein n=1 Tax=Novilysobacter arseniciresistens TaxID=1385522 RepID=UPI00068DC288|nr:GAF domain-containing protein [Lysobacter arseniciresistens]